MTLFAKLLDYGVWIFRVLEGPERYVMEEGIRLSCNEIFHSMPSWKHSCDENTSWDASALSHCC